MSLLNRVRMAILQYQIDRTFMKLDDLFEKYNELDIEVEEIPTCPVFRPEEKELH